MFLNSCLASFSATMNTLYISPLSKLRVGMKKLLTDIWRIISNYLLCPPLEWCLLMGIIERYKYFSLWSTLRALSKSNLCHYFSILFLSELQSLSQTVIHGPWICMVECQYLLYFHNSGALYHQALRPLTKFNLNERSKSNVQILVGWRSVNNYSEICCLK